MKSIRRGPSSPRLLPLVAAALLAASGAMGADSSQSAKKKKGETVEAAKRHPAPPAHPAPSASARPLRPAWSLAPRIGFLAPTSKLGTGFAMGAEVRWVPPRTAAPSLNEHLGIGLDLSFAQNSVQGSATDARVLPPAGPTYTWSLRSAVLPALLDLLYVDEIETRFAPVNLYGGAGFGWASAQTVESALGSQVVTSGGAFAAQLLGGVGVGMGPGDLFGELRYGYIGVNDKTTGSANLSGISFAAGYRLYF